jgi:UDP-glucuronate 4-epimerase
MGKTILLTGAAGFIGTATALRMLKRGDRVIGVDNFDPYYSLAQKRANVAEIQALGADFKFLELDVCDTVRLERVFSEFRPQAVIHLAALAGVRASVDAPHRYVDVNLHGPLNLMQAAARHGRPNLVLASTSSVYGRTQRIPFVETDTADHPVSPYGATKRSMELMGYCFHQMHRLDITCPRFFTVYGPRNRPDMMPSLVMQSIETQKPLQVYGHGKVSRDWTYVEDIVSGVVAAADRRLGYEIVNLGRGQPTLLSDFVDILSELAGRRPNAQEADLPAADVQSSFASIDKARRLLGYQPQTTLREGLGHFYRWYQTRPR